MPFVTGLSGIFLIFLSGSVLLEMVFSWPGMGRLFIAAVNARDYPVMMALFVISSFLGIIGVLMVDILYGFVDPRGTLWETVGHNGTGNAYTFICKTSRCGTADQGA